MSARRTVALLLIGAGLLVLTLKFSHVYDPVPAVDRFTAKLAAKASPGISKMLRRVQTGQVVFGALVIIPLGIGAGLLLTSRRAKTEPLEKAVPSAASRAAAIPASRLAKPAAIHSCNVL